LPPVTAAATTNRTGRHQRSYFEGRGEVVNSLVFFATSSRRHHRRLQLPLPPPPHVRAAAAAAGRGEDLSIWFLLGLGCSRVWMLCFWAVLADLGPDALDFGPNKQRSGAKLYAF